MSGDMDLQRASAILEELRPRLPAIREAKATLIATSERLRGVVQADGGGHDAGAPYRAAQALLASELTALAEMGVLLRDTDPVLLDFPSERDGEPTFLCWREPEPEIAWWHPRDTGFAGRRPL